MANKLIDITQTISEAVPVWPGDTPFSMTPTWTMDDSPVLVSKMTLSTHTGTHADAHTHYAQGAVDSAGRALMPYIGHCIVVEAFREQADVVLFDEIAAALDASPHIPERILIRTFETFPTTRWPERFRAISPELIRKVANLGCHLIGTDAPSIDPQESKTMDAHHVVHEHDMAILEGLVLDQVKPGEYELIALPLKIAGADATPVRAVLRT